MNNYKTIILWLLFGIHCIWLSTHAYLVSQDKINPWKLGGYGMYTGPSPRPYAEVSFKNIENDGFTVIPWNQLNFQGYHSASFHHNFYCKKITAKELDVFFQDNKHLRGHDIQIQVKVNAMQKDPISKIRKTISIVDIHWETQYKYTYHVQYCKGETYTDSSISYEK